MRQRPGFQGNKQYGEQSSARKREGIASDVLKVHSEDNSHGNKSSGAMQEESRKQKPRRMRN